MKVFIVSPLDLAVQSNKPILWGKGVEGAERENIFSLILVFVILKKKYFPIFLKKTHVF